MLISNINPYLLLFASINQNSFHTFLHFFDCLTRAVTTNSEQVLVVTASHVNAASNGRQWSSKPLPLLSSERY